jgi:15-cis-phytoene synthase
MDKKLYLSYKNNQELFKQHSKSYYLGSMLFSFEKFKHICTFYGLFRYVKDIVDANNIPIKEKKHKLNDIKKLFFFLYNISKCNLEKVNWDKYPIIFYSVFYTIHTLEIPKELFVRFFKSMEMDLEKFKYETYDHLLDYMDGSAAIVGEVMLYIMKCDSNYYDQKIDSFIRFAQSLGVAFQLTNFIRDINEDISMDPSRIYMPQNELEQFNINLNEYKLTKKIDHKFIEFIEFQINKNKEIYKFSQIGIDNLNVSDKKAINLSKILYSKILDKIQDKEYKLFDDKIRVNFLEKLWLVYTNLSFTLLITVIYNYISYSYFFYENFCSDN